MPFNVWCEHCEQHIGMGVRFNAEKKMVGKYYSTTVWGFRMKCHLCGGWMEIHTDPKNSCYVCKEGVRRKVEEPETMGEDTSFFKSRSAWVLFQSTYFFMCVLFRQGNNQVIGEQSVFQSRAACWTRTERQGHSAQAWCHSRVE